MCVFKYIFKKKKKLTLGCITHEWLSVLWDSSDYGFVPAKIQVYTIFFDGWNLNLTELAVSANKINSNKQNIFGMRKVYKNTIIIYRCHKEKQYLAKKLIKNIIICHDDNWLYATAKTNRKHI